MTRQLLRTLITKFQDHLLPPTKVFERKVFQASVPFFEEDMYNLINCKPEFLKKGKLVEVFKACVERNINVPKFSGWDKQTLITNFEQHFQEMKDV